MNFAPQPGLIFLAEGSAPYFGRYGAVPLTSGPAASFLPPYTIATTYPLLFFGLSQISTRLFPLVYHARIPLRGDPPGLMPCV